jgi:hypothetical protein
MHDRSNLRPTRADRGSSALMALPGAYTPQLEHAMS